MPTGVWNLIKSCNQKYYHNENFLFFSLEDYCTIKRKSRKMIYMFKAKTYQMEILRSAKFKINSY